MCKKEKWKQAFRGFLLPCASLPRFYFKSECFSEYFMCAYHMYICAQNLKSGPYYRFHKWCHHEMTQYQQFVVQANLFWPTLLFKEHDAFSSLWSILNCKSILSKHLLNLEMNAHPSFTFVDQPSAVHIPPSEFVWNLPMIKFKGGAQICKFWAETSFSALLEAVHRWWKSVLCTSFLCRSDGKVGPVWPHSWEVERWSSKPARTCAHA